MTEKETLGKKTLSDFAKTLTELKCLALEETSRAGFYKTWIDKTLSNLEMYTFYFTTCEDSHTDGYPAWKQSWNDGQIPHLATKNDQTPIRRKNIYRSWDDYFRKQRVVFNAFLKSGEIKTFCKELSWYIKEIVADKRTNYILKKWHSFILDVACSAHLAKRPVSLFYEIEQQMVSFDQSIHYYWGWHHQIVPMLPDYELGKARRAQVRIFAKHARSREDLNLEDRNSEIRVLADKIREKSNREKSNLEISTILSKPPHNFLSVNKKPLSIRQIRKIIS